MVASRHSGLYLCLLEQDLGSVFLLGCRLFCPECFFSPFSSPVPGDRVVHLWTWASAVHLAPLQAGWLCWPSPVPRVGKPPASIQSSLEAEVHACKCRIYWSSGVCAQSLQSCPTLCDPMGRSLPGSSVHGILHALFAL